MSDEQTQSGPEALDIVATGRKLNKMVSYLHSIHEALIEAIDESGDTPASHKLMLCRATIVQVGLQIDVIGGRLSKGPRQGVFDDLQMG
jgi:hypothetical protein